MLGAEKIREVVDRKTEQTVSEILEARDINIDGDYFEYNATNGIVAIPQPQEFSEEEIDEDPNDTETREVGPPVYSTVPGFESVLISESADEPDVVSTD